MLAAVFLLALAAACEPSIPQTSSPAAVTTAVFDPIAGNIPLPNDLARLPRPPGSPPFPAAQQELINLFNSQGGFPSDQELPVTISLVREVIAADGTTTKLAPTLDSTTVVNGATLVMFLKTPPGLVAIDPITDASYASLSDHGVLSIHNKNRAPWAPGQYVVGLRGGPNGVKTKEGDPIYASTTFFLIAQGQNLETEQNLTLLRAQTGSEAAARAAAKQLDQIINGYNQGAFQAVDQVFPHQELAAMTTFTIAPVAGTVVEVDSSRGIVPLPIDLLRDPRPVSATCPACGRLTPLAACTLAKGTLDAQGVCHDSTGKVSAAAAGFATLDGFSTTGMMLMPTSDLVQRASVTSTTVQLWDLKDPAAPVKVDPSTYITEPIEVTQQGLSQVIALQPAGATAQDPSNPVPSVFRTRPLTDNNDYAVIVSKDVLDRSGKGLVPGTVARILRFSNPISVGGKSQLVGIDDQTASALEAMRLKLPPVIAASGFATDQIAMAYTFHTQSITAPAVLLGALPYDPALPAATALPAALDTSILNATDAFTKYGVDQTVPKSNINEILETSITTFDLLDPATGAFRNPPSFQPISIRVMIATPKAATVTGACPAGFPGTVKCAPMVVFRHGIGDGRADMLAIADAFAAKGFVTVAIDAAKHGDRSLCTGGQVTTTINGITVPQCGTLGAPVACITTLPAGAQGDVNPPGSCGAAGLIKRTVSATCTGSCATAATDGIALVSSNYVVSANFFRTRDTFRQDIVDQSQLVRALAFVPSGPPDGSGNFGHSVFDHTKGAANDGFVISPTEIYFVGQSLGSIQGAADVATNPRIKRAVLNTGGGTVVDIFTTSPAFVTSVTALLAGLGIQPGTPEYLQFLVVAKTILDPADPVNFAWHLTDANNTLQVAPGSTQKQAKKDILTQAAFCDQTVPNPWNYILDSTAGTGPMPGLPLFPATRATFQLFFKGDPTAPGALSSCPTPASTSPNAVPHGFLLDGSAWTAQAQADAATFLVDPANTSNVIPSIRSFP